MWERHPGAKFFLRAETFYNTATAYEGVGVRGSHELSHGESFLDAVERLIHPGSFVVMDEPESALSVTGQLKLMAPSITWWRTAPSSSSPHTRRSC